MTTEAADVLLEHGLIRTGWPGLPITDALAISHGRILAYGNAARSLRGPKTIQLDLRGGLALPGFTDAHIHLLSYGITLDEVNLTDVADYAEVERRLQERIALTSPGTWIHGSGWNQDLWNGIQPSCHLLDRLSPVHPIALTRKDGHSLWVNSLALAKADIQRETPDPAGGHIERSDDGSPTGILAETAMDRVTRLLPADDSDRFYQAVLRAMQRASAAGITGIHDFEGPDARAAFTRAREHDTLTLRVHMMIDLPTWRAGWPPAHHPRNDDMLQTGHLKIFADGALGSRTAAMFEPYNGTPTNRGIVVTPREELQTLITAAAHQQIPCAIHAIGDYANHFVLDTFAATQSTWAPQALHPRIEHVQLLHPDDLHRLAQLGITASMQPIHATSDMLIAERFWGQRCASGYPWRTLLDHGTSLAFGSDSPVETLDVLQGLYAAVTRRSPSGFSLAGWHPEQCLSIEEAVAAYTYGAAQAVNREHELGDLRPGKWADITILDRDILSAPPQALLETNVIATIVRGRTIYERS
ncbi:MAG: amidohydrolase [Chloroflexi bacterium]|nr:amidohydrolase [Chloroflexota bacterium]